MTREQSLSVLKLMQSLPLVSLCIDGLGAGLGCSEGLSPWARGILRLTLVLMNIYILATSFHGS